MYKIKTTAEFTFVRGGVAKNGKSYLQVSNGLNTFFLKIPDTVEITKESFQKYNELDEIQLDVEFLPGTENVTLLGLPE